MGQRSRKRRAGAVAGTSAKPEANAGMRRGYARGEARNQAVRDQLEPLEAGERPGAVTVAAVVATLLGFGNLAFFLAGYEVRGAEPALFGVILLSVLLLVAAGGMWLRQYWAVLGFQALLGITLVYALIALLLYAADLRGIAVCLVTLALAGTLFWKLIRAMARIQMPERPRRTPTG